MELKLCKPRASLSTIRRSASIQRSPKIKPRFSTVSRLSETRHGSKPKGSISFKTPFSSPRRFRRKRSNKCRNLSSPSNLKQFVKDLRIKKIEEARNLDEKIDACEMEIDTLKLVFKNAKMQTLYYKNLLRMIDDEIFQENNEKMKSEEKLNLNGFQQKEKEFIGKPHCDDLFFGTDENDENLVDYGSETPVNQIRNSVTDLASPDESLNQSENINSQSPIRRARESINSQGTIDLSTPASSSSLLSNLTSRSTNPNTSLSNSKSSPSERCSENQFYAEENVENICEIKHHESFKKQITENFELNQKPKNLDPKVPLTPRDMGHINKFS